ncbi:MAG TPA: TIGR04104 family putative zinc finger protein [Bacillota bacterium]|nr:TIGR04104 family putative zinc finger protein [Bacillota bacterium]
MPLCSHCKQKWKYFQTLKYFGRTFMYCPYCKELNVQTEISRRLERLISLFVLIPVFLLFIVFDVPQMVAVGAGVAFLVGFYLAYPLILDVGKRKMN